MKQTVKRDKHSEIVEQRARKSATYRKTFGRTCIRLTWPYSSARCGRMRG